MADVTRIGAGNLATSALTRRLGGTLGQALERFDDVLRSTMGQGDEAGTAGLTASGAAAESNRTTTPRVATGQVGELSQAVSDAVNSRLEQVRGTETQHRENVQTMLSGGDIELHNVIMSAERAKLELQLTMQLRNKLIEAYQEVMRTPV